jgi:hypothetical protein
MTGGRAAIEEANEKRAVDFDFFDDEDRASEGQSTVR